MAAAFDATFDGSDIVVVAVPFCAGIGAGSDLLQAETAATATHNPRIEDLIRSLYGFRRDSFQCHGAYSGHGA